MCVDGFLDLSKAFYYSLQLSSFYLFLRNYFLFLKMLNETLLRIPFSVIGRRSLELPERFYRITGGLLSAFSMSKSPLQGLWSELLEGSKYTSCRSPPIHFESHWKGWALKIETFRLCHFEDHSFKGDSLIAISGHKKVSIFRPTPSNGPTNGFDHIKIITSRACINWHIYI